MNKSSKKRASILLLICSLITLQTNAQRRTFFDAYNCNDYKSFNLRLVNFTDKGEKHIIANDSRMEISLIHKGEKIVIPSKADSKVFEGRSATVFDNCTVYLDGFPVENCNQYIAFYKEYNDKIAQLKSGNDYSAGMYGFPNTRDPENLRKGIGIAQGLIKQFGAFAKEIQAKLNANDVSKTFDDQNYLKRLISSCETSISICQRVISDNESAINNEKKEAQKNKEDASAKELENMREKLEADVHASANTADATATTDEEDNFWNGSEEQSNADNNNNNNNSEDDFWNGGEDPDATTNGKSNSSGIEALMDFDNRLLSLKNPDGTIIKEWSMANHGSLEKIDEGANFFILGNKRSGYGPLDENRYSIIDKQGNPVLVDGHEFFASAHPRKEGGFSLTINASESLYAEKVEMGKNFSSVYNSSAEAIADLKSYAVEREEEIRVKRSDDRPGTVYFTSISKYNVIQKKELITDSNMQLLLTETYYIINN